MVQWAELNWNNKFVNLSTFPWLSENSGAIHLALPGPIAGRQANEIQANLKIHCTSKFLLFASFNQGIALLLSIFSGKTNSKAAFNPKIHEAI